MKIMSTFFFFLSLSLCLTVHPGLVAARAVYITESAVNNPELVQQACGQARDKNFCINLLSADKVDGPKRTLKDIAFIAFKTVEKNATETAMYIKAIAYDNKMKPSVQEALYDCRENYVSLDDLIEDVIDELALGDYKDAVKFANAALDAVKACDAEVKDQHPEVAAKNLGVLQMLDAAISVANVAAAAGAAAH